MCCVSVYCLCVCLCVYFCGGCVTPYLLLSLVVCLCIVCVCVCVVAVSYIQFNSIQFYLYSAITIQLSLYVLCFCVLFMCVFVWWLCPICVVCAVYCLCVCLCVFVWWMCHPILLLSLVVCNLISPCLTHTNFFIMAPIETQQFINYQFSCLLITHGSH